MEEGRKRGRGGREGRQWVRGCWWWVNTLLPSIPHSQDAAPALRPPELSLFIQASGPPFHTRCKALGHHPDALGVSWVLLGQYCGEDFTEGAADPRVSWLWPPQEVAGMSVTCQGQHQSGASRLCRPCPGAKASTEDLGVLLFLQVQPPGT